MEMLSFQINRDKPRQYWMKKALQTNAYCREKNVSACTLTEAREQYLMIQIHPGIADRIFHSPFCRNLSWISHRKEDLALPILEKEMEITKC